MAMRKTTSKIKRRVLTLINAVLIFALAFIAFLQFLSPQLSLKIFGFQAYLISYTGSMEPDLNYNDLIIVKKFDFDKLEKHDYITFLAYTNDGRQVTITHEVWDIKDENGVRMIQTKGTAHSSPDIIPVTINGNDGTNIYIGKYVYKNSFLGHLVAYLKSPKGFIALAINVVCIACIYILLNEKPRSLFGSN